MLEELATGRDERSDYYWLNRRTYVNVRRGSLRYAAMAEAISEAQRVTRPLPPLREADLPERTLPFWKLTGPGAVLVGLSIGAGEIVVWPRLTAEYGAGMAWAAVLGVFFQFWINVEIGRWAVATGESAYAGMSRVWRGLGIAFMAFNFFGFFFPGWARISGSALKALIMQDPKHPSPDWVWTTITFSLVAGCLFGPKRIYAAVEKIVSVLVVIITLGLIVIGLRVGTWESLRELLAGVVNVGHKAEGVSVKTLFIAIVFAGAGGTGNLFYAFYLRDKRIGMGARVPPLISAFRQGDEASQPREQEARTGFTFPDTPENARRFRDWFRFVFLDTALYFWLLNTFTILLFIYGALVVLKPQGIVPAEGTLIWDEALVLEQSMGPAGRILFLVIGLATLFSTQLTLVDGVSRSMADIMHNTFRAPRRVASESTWYAGWAWFMMLFGVVITFLLERGGVGGLAFVFNAAYVGGFAMAVYVPMMLFINLRYLPKSARPGWLNIVMVSIAAAVYVGFAGYCVWTCGMR